MSKGLSRRRWLAGSSVAAMSYAVTPSVQAETTVNWSSTAAIQCQLTDFRDRVGTGVVLTALAASPGGESLAAAGEDRKIRIIRTADLRTTQTLVGHRDRIRGLAFDREGRFLASAGNDGQLFLYDCSGDYQTIHRFAGNPALSDVAFGPRDPRLAIVGFSGRVTVIDSDHQTSRGFECGSRDLRAVAFRDDSGVLAVGGRDGRLLLLDPNDGHKIAEATLHRGRIRGLCFHRQSNEIVSIGEDGTAIVYDTKNHSVLHRIEVSSGKLFSITVLNSQLVAVAGSDNHVRILNTDQGNVVRRLKDHNGSVTCLASTGTSLLSAGFDATLRRWSVGSGTTRTERIAESDPTKDR
ncbi:MAG: WD40 repeat domain-containing protein [Rubripirellula sp.]|nr:WD40 repeat domain-containing protein [Rubripirellula sp.]